MCLLTDYYENTYVVFIQSKCMYVPIYEELGVLVL